MRKAPGGTDDDAELELVHESLIHRWDRLARWLEESREERDRLAELEQAVELWERRGRRPDETWSGDALREAQRTLSRATAAVPPRLRSFVESGLHRERRRQRWKRLGVAGVLVVAAAVALLSTLFSLALSRREQEANRQRRHAERQRHQARTRWAQAQIEGARASLSRGRLLEAKAKLRNALEFDDFAAARGLWWRIRRSPLIWTAWLSDSAHRLAFSPNGKTLAVPSHDGSLYLLDTATREMRVLRNNPGPVTSAAWSPDGRLLAASTHEGPLVVWDVEANSRLVLDGHQGAVWRVAWSPDGKHLASAGWDGTVRLWDPRTRALRKTLTDHQGRVSDVTWSPDGKRLASAGDDGTVRLWDAPTGQPQGVLRGHAGAAYSVIYTPEAKQIISGAADGTIRIWDASAGGAPATVLRGHTKPVVCLAITRDGARLISASLDHTVRRWDLTPGQTRRSPRTLQRAEAGVVGVTVSPDGRLLASGDDNGVVRLQRLMAQRLAVEPIRVQPPGPARRCSPGSGTAPWASGAGRRALPWRLDSCGAR